MHNVAGRFAALIALFVLAVPAVRAATVPDGGLLVTRVNSEQWEITLVGGSISRGFSGSVTSSMPFYTSSGAGLESSDVVTQTSTATLNMTLDVAAGRVDTARFSVSGDASLCLRGSGTPIYVGESLDDATPVSAPVALNGADACGSTSTSSMSSTTEPVTTLATTTRKYHKGHYIALMSCCDSPQTMAASMKPGVKGFMKRYQWKELEPTQGNYNFSEIQADLTWCAAHGMQLIIMVEDKTFGSSLRPGNPAPLYLA